MTSIIVDRIDGLSSAAAIKGPCRLATTTNIVLSGLQVVDSAMAVAGDRIVVKDQNAGSENGIWVADTGPWRRSKDFNKTRDVVTGTSVFVTDGTVNGETLWTVTTANMINVGTTPIAFSNDIMIPPGDIIAWTVATRTILKSLDTTRITTAYLKEAGREGTFKWTTGDYSAQITADTQEGIYIKADAIASTAGAWVRVYHSTIIPSWFGSVDLTGVVSCQTAAEAVVAAAFASGDYIEWADGVFSTTANIPNFHDVKHVGPGVIKRGSDTFAVSPQEGQTNILYVAASGGASTNDGLSSSQAISSLQGAFNAFKNYWPLNGKWVVKLAAGAFSSAAQRAARLGPANESETNPDDDNFTSNGMSMRNMLTIQGPDVGYDPATAPTPTPTAIFDGGGAAAVGIQLERGLKVLVKDIKLQNYSGSSSSAGIAADGQCWIRAENVHADASMFGIRALNHSQLEVKGGTINACTTGLQSIFATKHEIGNQLAVTAGQGPFITNCTTGFQAQEGATGHSDFVSYADNTIGVDAQVNSRVNLNGSDFKRNTVCWRHSNSNIYPFGVSLHMGTADANTEIMRCLDSGAIGAENTTAWREIAANLAPTSSSGTTETTVASFTLDTFKLSSVPTSIYPGKALKVRAAGSITGIAGTKSFRLRLGGTLLAGGAIELDANGGYIFEGEVRLLTSATQATALVVEAGSGTNRIKTVVATSSVNTIVAGTLALTFTVQCANAADSVVTSFVTLELKG